MTKKIKTHSEGKKFEAYVKLIMSKSDEYGNNVLIGIAFAGTVVACRAIYASLYNEPYIEIHDEETGRTERYFTQKYTRIEEINNRIMHVFALPRTAIETEYKKMVEESIKNELNTLPSKVIMSKNNLTEEIGYFLAENFGLPKTREWVMQYESLLPLDKIEKINVEETDLAGDLKGYKAVLLKELSESEVLSYVEIGIRMGVLQTKSDEVTQSATFQKDWTTEEYLRANAEVLLAKIDEYTKPLYDGTHFSKHIAELERLPVPAQAKTVMGLNAILKEKKGAFLVGGMSVGKTQVSLTTAYDRARKREVSGAKDGYRVLIVSPAKVLSKWAMSEIPTILGRTCEISPNDIANIDNYRYSPDHNKVRLWRKYNLSSNIVTIIRNTEEALQYVKLIKSGWRVPKGKIHFVLVSTDRMKLSASSFVLGAKWCPRRYTWISPNTFKPLQSPSLNEEERKTGIQSTWTDVVESPSIPPTKTMIEHARKTGNITPQGLPIGYVEKWRGIVRSFQDDYEGKPNRSLARPAIRKYGETNHRDRWMIAQIFQKKLPNHFHFGIYDEIHEMRSQGSGRGLAFHKLLKSCRKSIFLTGTLTNGHSSSIQAVLWRVFPQELLDYGFNHETSAIKWAERYGVVERVQKLDDENEVGITTNRRKQPVLVEKAGISPELVANHLLDKAVFLELSELEVPLVTLEEKPIIVELDDEHLEEYKKFHSTLYETAQSKQHEIGSSAWSRFNPTTINYADQPSLDITVEFRNREGELTESVIATKFPENYITAKERKLIEIVKERVRKNRGVMIYTRFTRGYGTDERLQWVLQQAGIESKILKSSVNPDKRFEWLEEQVRNGTKVVISSQTLVEVGLDLLAFPTIIFYQLHDDINVVRQAGKRSHRLGQSKHCEVLYLVADKTQQMAQFQRLMSRRVSALLVEGVIERSNELAKYADVSVARLTNDLSKMLEASEVAKAWEETAKKDIDQNVELVSEHELQQKINGAFEKLTEETKRLCGYVEPKEEVKEQEEVPIDLAWAELEFESEYEQTESLSLFDYVEVNRSESEEEKANDEDRKVEQLSIFDLV